MRSANIAATRRQNHPICESTFAFDVAIDVPNWLRRQLGSVESFQSCCLDIEILEDRRMPQI
jgi:hypothetical protein